MLYLFNTTIAPNEGVYVCQKITAERAVEIFKSTSSVTSALGHQGSADAFTALGMPCDVNRIHATMAVGDQAICLKVLGRVAEGQILDITALNAVGFEFYLLSNIAPIVAGQVIECQVGGASSSPHTFHQLEK